MTSKNDKEMRRAFSQMIANFTYLDVVGDGGAATAAASNVTDKGRNAIFQKFTTKTATYVKIDEQIQLQDDFRYIVRSVHVCRLSRLTLGHSCRWLVTHMIQYFFNTMRALGVKHVYQLKLPIAKIGYMVHLLALNLETLRKCFIFTQVLRERRHSHSRRT